MIVRQIDLSEPAGIMSLVIIYHKCPIDLLGDHLPSGIEIRNTLTNICHYADEGLALPSNGYH